MNQFLICHLQALQCLQRAHRLVTQDEHWQREVSKVKEVIDETHTLAEGENVGRKRYCVPLVKLHMCFMPTLF